MANEYQVKWVQATMLECVDSINALVDSTGVKYEVEFLADGQASLRILEDEAGVDWDEILSIMKSMLAIINLLSSESLLRTTEGLPHNDRVKELSTWFNAVASMTASSAHESMSTLRDSVQIHTEVPVKY